MCNILARKIIFFYLGNYSKLWKSIMLFHTNIIFKCFEQQTQKIRKHLVGVGWSRKWFFLLTRNS
jgi:hypothetical protein